MGGQESTPPGKRGIAMPWPHFRDWTTPRNTNPCRFTTGLCGVDTTADIPHRCKSLWSRRYRRRVARQKRKGVPLQILCRSGLTKTCGTEATVLGDLASFDQVPGSGRHRFARGFTPALRAFFEDRPLGRSWVMKKNVSEAAQSETLDTSWSSKEPVPGGFPRTTADRGDSSAWLASLIHRES